MSASKAVQCVLARYNLHCSAGEVSSRQLLSAALPHAASTRKQNKLSRASTAPSVSAQLQSHPVLHTSESIGSCIERLASEIGSPMRSKSPGRSVPMPATPNLARIHLGPAIADPSDHAAATAQSSMANQDAEILARTDTINLISGSDASNSESGGAVLSSRCPVNADSSVDHQSWSANCSLASTQSKTSHLMVHVLLLCCSIFAGLVCTFAIWVQSMQAIPNVIWHPT